MFKTFVADSLSYIDGRRVDKCRSQQMTDAYLAALAGDLDDGLIKFKAGVAQA